MLIGLAPKDVFIVNILDEKRVASPLCEPKAAHTVARRRNNGSLWVARSAWELTRKARFKHSEYYRWVYDNKPDWQYL